MTHLQALLQFLFDTTFHLTPENDKPTIIYNLDIQAGVVALENDMITFLFICACFVMTSLEVFIRHKRGNAHTY